MKKKYLFLCLFFIVMIFILFVILFGNNEQNNTTVKGEKELELKKLPNPEVTGGERGKLGIDKNINELTIDDYLGRSDSIYRDMRMLKDPGNYEAIGGDSYLSGYIKGFEIVSLPYIIPVSGLPEEVGDTYTGDTLFRIDEDGNYVANYEESLSIIEQLFPKDKYIFLMCGGGGYAGMTKNFLVSLGWDENKIYNIGGYWFYNGKNNVEVKKYIDGNITYDFDSVPYHDIDFDKLIKVKAEPNTLKVPISLSEEYYNKIGDQVFDIDLDLNQTRGFDLDIPEEKIKADNLFNELVDKKVNIINNLMIDKKSFIVRVQATDGPCMTVAGPNFILLNSIKQILFKNNIYSYEINLPILKKSNLYDVVKYAPTVIIVKEGDVYAYIDANKDLIESDEQLLDWINTYVKLDN